MTSTTESVPVFVTEDNKELVAAQLASTVWWNGYQQLPLSAAVNNFSNDDMVSFDQTNCDENNVPYYTVPMIDSSGSQWPTSVQPVADHEELYVSATPMSSVVDHRYKYQTTTQSAMDYAMLECYAAVADPSAASQSPWTSGIPYADTTSSYHVCCSTSVPAVSMDYCNSLQMMQCGAAFNGYVNHYETDVEHVGQQCDTSSYDKAAST